jgi:sarcosine oxidase
MSEQYDVIVVGLGAMGSAALYQLAKRGANVLGIDQYDPPHDQGSSHGETRITRLAVGEGAQYVPLVKRTHDIWRELEAESGETLLYQSGGLIICPEDGGAQFHAQNDFVTRSAQIARDNDIAHKVLDADAMKDWLPSLKVEPGEHGYYEPTGGVVYPEKCIAAQLGCAKQRGAAVRVNEPMVSYEAGASGVTVTTTSGMYHAEKVILAAGAWMKDWLDTAPLKVYRQVIYWFEAEDIGQFATDQFPFVIWIGDTLDEFFTAFPVPHYGTPALKVLTEEYAQDTTPEEVEREVQPEEIERFYRDFVRRRMSGVTSKCVHAGVCMYTNTPDENFLIDFHPASERVVVASPCSGHGFKHAGAIGEILAQLALDGESTFDIRSFAMDRFAE